MIDMTRNSMLILKKNDVEANSTQFPMLPESKSGVGRGSVPWNEYNIGTFCRPRSRSERKSDEAAKSKEQLEHFSL